VLKTFFDGSTEQAISALLDESAAKLSDAELDRLAQMIDQARTTGAE
jgi:ABC-type sugar transport system ATPase subunit